MSRLLVVDFDFWFFNAMEAGTGDRNTLALWDWGHAESPLYLSNMLWSTRAGSFLMYDQPLPRVAPPTGGWPSFWDRFTFAPDTVLKYGDSNIHSGDLEPPDGEYAFEEVVLFDAHHDCGYGLESMADFISAGRYSCEDWMLVHQMRGAELSVRYPTWKPNGPTETIPSGVEVTRTVDDGLPVSNVFDAVYVCRSGAWVPPWSDAEFLALLDAAPFLEREQLDDLPMDREFDLADARAFADQILTSRNTSS